jgi:hypothetical protein
MSCPQCFTSGNDPGLTVQEVGLAPGPVWMGAENLSLVRFDPWAIQPSVRRYINYTNRLPNITIYLFYLKFHTPPANTC